MGSLAAQSRRLSGDQVAFFRRSLFQYTSSPPSMRLSDLMFVLARVLNRMDGGDDVYWKSERLKNAT